MYYSSGNYEAFARPLKPEGIEHKSAYFVGTGLAALSAGCFLVRDAQMPGKNIHFFDRDPIAGGACDGWNYPEIGYVMRGGREMDNHFEVMWDLFRSIPSIETEGVSVLDEYYWLNKADPNYSLCRVTEKRGQNAHTDGKFCLSDKAALQLTRLIFTPDEELEEKRITDVLDAEVLNSNFWTYWRTMFAFYDCNSALEMKRYMQRFIHHIDGLPDLRALRFTKYNQYESMILPMVKYLESHGAQFHFNTQVMDVRFDIHDGRKVAKRVELLVDGRQEFLDLTESDYLFITNGSNVENSSIGGQDKTCEYIKEIRPGGSFDLWRKIAAQDPSFGHPEKFYGNPEECNWMGVTVNTLDDKILPYIKNICQRDPLAGKVVTGGIVTARDSGWLLSWTINRQPQFHSQPKVWPVHRSPRRLRQEEHARLHRQGDLHGVAVSSRRPRGSDRGAGLQQCQDDPCYDAVRQRVFHAAHRRRQTGSRAGGRCELRLPRQFRGGPERYRVHHGVFHAHGHGGGLHPHERGSRRPGGLGQHL